jgi:hypothetical protein
VNHHPRWVVVIAFLLTLVNPWQVASSYADQSPVHYAGWAVEAYPDLSAGEMETMVRRLVDAGANVVWIGHNNPGEVEADKVEPGLSYAVYQAYLDPADPRHETAIAVVEAQHRILTVCRTVGVQAVLPVGYQIQMGRRWNEEHPDDLRRDAEGELLDIYGGGVSASFHAGSYRQDIETYYRWVDEEFARPYADVLLMLNLADEPIGGDYSSHAEAEFRRRHGFGFSGLGDAPLHNRLLGEFQSRYVVEYAIFSAELWGEIHPGLPVTMSFDGGQARRVLTLPDVEALFRDTPSNFVVTFDAYPRDGPPHIPLQHASLVRLFLLVRSLGLYSARYGKPVWLWAAANSWGLSQESPDPGTVSDAVANGLYLALLFSLAPAGSAQGAGGDLRGIVYWNYNVKEQGLYNDTHETAYDPETMFTQVSAGLPTLRRLIATPGPPCKGPAPSHPWDKCVLILAPPAVAHHAIGAARGTVRLEVQPYERLEILVKEGVRAAVVCSLGDMSLDGVRAVVVLSPAVSYLSLGDLAILREYVERGGRVVTSPAVGIALAKATGAVPELVFDGLVERWGNLFVAQKGVAVLFEDNRHNVLSAFWQEVIGLDASQPGYRIAAGRYVFHYNISAEPVVVRWELPFPTMGYRHDDQARPVERIHGSDLAVTLGRREYVFLRRIRRSHRQRAR